jgi:hypothetical protein
MTDDTSANLVFDSLAHPYRRHLLLALLERNPRSDDRLDPMDLLASGTVDGLAVTTLGAIHVHLPKLADMGFVEWDRDSGVVSEGPGWEEVAPLCRLMRDHRDELPEGWLHGSAAPGRDRD